MASPGPSPVKELTTAEGRELDALLGKLLLPSFTPREVEIASATARAVLAHVRAVLPASARPTAEQIARVERMRDTACSESMAAPQGTPDSIRYSADADALAALPVAAPPAVTPTFADATEWAAEVERQLSAFRPHFKPDQHTRAVLLQAALRLAAALGGPNG